MTPTDLPSTNGGPASGPLVAGVDLLTSSERHADAVAVACAAALSARGARDVTAATHWAVTGEVRHVALSFAVTELSPAEVTAALVATVAAEGVEPAVLVADAYTGPPDRRQATAAAVAAHREATSGRVVVFPGSTALTGRLPVAKILAGSTIARVRVLAAGEAEPGTLVETRDFVRPRWSDGQLVLDTQEAAGGVLVPFETPNPTPCCAVHA